MGKDNRNTPTKLILFCVLFTFILISESFLVITSPLLIVRVINLVAVIGISLIIGAFIREIFILKNGEKSKSK
ncbi:hypothetical protein [Metabacillus litoralis]|uniref:hypothetical protein n=1 Tax=Metabacillus litoralis TaxID=152268 RepID=UPI001CFE79BC|nr:hypothetical protein [Metabacillus litoralis]